MVVPRPLQGLAGRVFSSGFRFTNHGGDHAVEPEGAFAPGAGESETSKFTEGAARRANAPAAFRVSE